MNFNSLKNIKICLLIILFPFIVSGQKTDYTRWNIKGKVKSINEKSYKSGKADKDSMEYFYINEFNSFGNKIVDTKYFPDGKIEKNYIYKYDGQNRRIEENQYFSDGKLSRTIVYEYDNKGFLYEDSSYSGQGKPEKIIKYLYDNNGNVIEDNSYNSERKLLKKFAYNYDNKGNKTELRKYLPDGKLDLRTTYKYDSHNNIIEESYFKDDNSSMGNFVFNYVYDAQNNWIKKEKKHGGKTDNLIIREIIYFK